MALVINDNISIEGRYRKSPVDYRYGPWDSLYYAVDNLGNPSDSSSQNRVYYGLTVGVKVWDDSDPPNVVGVDEYWWQPSCVWDEVQSKFVDGFVRKFPANVPSTTEGKTEGTSNVLGMDETSTNYSTEWTEGGKMHWHELTVQE